MLVQRMPWSQIEAVLAPALTHQNRTVSRVGEASLSGPSMLLGGARVSVEGPPRLTLGPPVRSGSACHRTPVLADQAQEEGRS